MIKPIEIPLHPSRRLATALIAAHSLALIVLWGVLPIWHLAGSTMKSALSAPTVIGAKIALSILVVCSLFWTLRHILRPQLVALRVNVKGVFSVQQRDGDWLEAALLGSSFIASYLTILNLRLPGKYWQRHIVLVPDAVQADAFRRLRIWLRWGRN